MKKVAPKSVPTTLNVALIGSDARSKDENGRSDSLMVAQYDQKTQQAKLISIMRDSYVDIPVTEWIKSMQRTLTEELIY